MKYLPAALFTAISVFAQSHTTTMYRGRPVVAHQVIVRLAPDAPVPSGELIPLSASSGIYLLRSRTKDIRELLAEAGVAAAEPDYVIHTQGAALPSESQYGQLWGLARIAAPAAWKISTGSPAVSVAVIDTGVDYTHPDLAANIWSAPSEFTVYFGAVPITCPAGSHGFNAIRLTCDPMDDNGHGTHVSGTIGAAGNGSGGLVGVNQASPIVGIKFIDEHGDGTLSNAIRAIDFAIQINRIFPQLNLRVLSASWGSGDYSQALEDQISQAGDSNMLFVAAAGNDASSIDAEFSHFYPASYPLENVVAVTASDENDRIASFANFGPQTIHLAAPGVRILSTYLAAGYAIGSGTSMATPHVSGAAVLALGACPWLSTQELKLLLLATADPMSKDYEYISGGRLKAETAVRLCSSFRPARETSSGPETAGSNTPESQSEGRRR